MTQRLLLLRHARAAPWIPGTADYDRALTQRGRNHMAQLIDWFDEHLEPPQRILCSPARRTRMTLERFVERWPALDERVRLVPEIYEATTGTLHALAEAAFQDSRSVLLVGHNPGLESLARAVLNEELHGHAHRMPSGTLVVIDFLNGYHEDAGNGVLQHWIRQADLENERSV